MGKVKILIIKTLMIITTKIIITLEKLIVICSNKQKEVSFETYWIKNF